MKESDKNKPVQAKVKADPGTKRDLESKKSIKVQELKIAYLEAKRRTLVYEKSNYTQLVLVKTHEGWWKMFGHSAVFYKYMVAKRMHISVKLLPDTDYDVVSEEGCISISDFEEFRRKMKLAKIFLVKITNSVAIFDLGERVSEQDYVLMIREDEVSLEMANKLILPEERMTELNTKTKAAHKSIHEMVRKMDGVSRENFANDMERSVVRLQILVLRVARGTTDVDDCLSQAYDIAEDLYGYALMTLNLRLVEAKKVYEVTETIVALERQIKKEMRKRSMDRVEAEAKAKAKKISKKTKSNAG